MKTTTIKKSALALMACILALAFALVGCGGSKADPEEAFLGSWKLSGGEIYGEELDDETIKTMEEWGLNCILILDEDGEGQLDLLGDVEDITWKVKSDGTAKISAKGVDFKATLKDVIENGNWANYGGKIATLGLVSGDDPERNYVQNPMESTQWTDNSTKDDYKALVKSMFDGTVKVSDDTSAMPAHNIIVNEYDNIM